MILSMSVATFTQFHVILSLIGIAAGIVVVPGMLAANRMPTLTGLFLATTVATSCRALALDLCHHRRAQVSPTGAGGNGRGPRALQLTDRECVACAAW